MQANCVLISEKDNVCVAIKALKAGDAILGIEGLDLSANQDIIKNHKVAIKELAANSPVIKYGESIGLASKDIKPGDWVHTHNLKAEEEGE